MERLMAIAGGLTLVYPGLLTDLIGFGLIAVVVALQLIARNKEVVVEAAKYPSGPIK
jgi:UPF0716 family protein affecting phage T7 exclusion